MDSLLPVYYGVRKCSVFCTIFTGLRMKFSVCYWGGSLRRSEAGQLLQCRQHLPT
jgi:hypothetical protein